MRCGKCKLVHYCGTNCQQRHWKYHKKDCKTATQQIGLLQQEVQELKTVPEIAACSICLLKGGTIQHPVMFKDCHHVFCLKCLECYQEVSQSIVTNTTCPHCRTKTSRDNDRETILANVLLYTARASRSETKKTEACQLAFEDMASLGKSDSDQDVLQANAICAKLAEIKGDYKDSLRILKQNEQILQKRAGRKKELDALLQKGKVLGQSVKSTNYDKDTDDDISGSLDDDTYNKMQNIQNQVLALMAQGGMAKEVDLIQNQIDQINVHLLMKDWETARICHQELMTEYPQEKLSPTQQVQIFTGFSRCLFEEGNFDDCINMGEAALRVNRHSPGVNQYTALAYKAKGDLEKAQHVIARAILYEAPWDVDLRARNRELWIQLMEEG